MKRASTPASSIARTASGPRRWSVRTVIANPPGGVAGPHPAAERFPDRQARSVEAQVGQRGGYEGDLAPVDGRLGTLTHRALEPTRTRHVGRVTRPASRSSSSHWRPSSSSRLAPRYAEASDLHRGVGRGHRGVLPRVPTRVSTRCHENLLTNRGQMAPGDPCAILSTGPDLGFCADSACRRGDLNPHALAGTRPSTWRVYQFRHSDVGR